MINSPSHSRLSAWKKRLLDLSRRNPLLSLPVKQGLRLVGPDAFTAAAWLLSDEKKACTPLGLPLSHEGFPGCLAFLEAALAARATKGRKPCSEEESALGALLVECQARPSPEDPREIPGVQEPSPLEEGIPSANIPVLVDGLTSETTVLGRRVVRWSDIGGEGQAALAQWAALNKTLVFDAENEEDLQDDLAALARKMRADQEEMGTHTLFLAVGLLRWCEKKGSRACDAPLFLVPVELSRAHAGAAFSLSVRDDDVVLNPAIELQLMNLLGLDLSPARLLLTNDTLSPVQALTQALEAVRAALAQMPESRRPLVALYNEGRLASLSYARNRLWQDLESRAEQVLAHPVVAQLIDPARAPQRMETDSLFWDHLDKNYPPTAIQLPLAADASQLRAIVRADRGENLVIQGPPGTGKSQTIANLIAHFMGQGKRVLFVAEKMTALEVVHARLADIGLKPFCLELHASHASKSGVLDQLREGLEARLLPAVSGFEEQAATIYAKRLALNESLDVLHKTHPNSLTAYRAMGLLAGMDPAVPVLRSLSFPQVLQEDALAHPARREALRRYLIAKRVLPAAASVFRPLESMPLDAATEFFGLIDLWRRQRVEVTRAVRQAGPALEKLLEGDLDVFRRQTEAWLVLREGALAAGPADPAVTLSMLNPRAWKAWLEFSAAEKAWKKSFEPFWNVYHSSLWSTEDGASAIRMDWVKAEKSWPPLRWWLRRALVRRLGVHRRDALTTAPALDALMHAWPTVLKRKKARDAAQKTWQQESALPDAMACFPLASVMEESAKKLWDGMAKWSSDEQSSFLVWASQEIREPGSQINRSWAGGRELLSLLDQVLVVRAGLLPYLRLAGVSAWDTFEKIDAVVSPWQEAQACWPAWDTAHRVEVQAKAMRLGPLLQALAEGEVSSEQAPDVLEKTWLTAFVNQVLVKNSEHADHLGSARADAIGAFVKNEEDFEQLTRKHLAATVAQRARLADVEKMPGMAILRRELAKKRQHLPPRRLLREIASIASIIKPCMLMSPLTVAEVLGPDTPPFDLVIFDEASQIPVADAVGAISHGRQVVVVGDPKQMPPSTYFMAVGSDDEDEPSENDEETLRDMESVLDECLATMEHEMLNWHYRSRHEDLIAFSNHRYYSGALISFPSVAIQVPGVSEDVLVGPEGLSVHPIQGIYDRGSSHTNPMEAAAVVSTMREYVERYPNLSLGVITFNQPQQRLIEKLWDRVLRTEPKIEVLADAMPQELFVKNLENVQGDERDIILFSTTFGPDVAGKMTMNFGPLNRLGGERRLNVAITRARQCMEIFSSFSPSDIDVRTVRNQGPVDLRDYLVFASGGAKALAGVSSASIGLPDSPFEIAVAQALRSRGWKVEEQIGCSGYKIDLAVVDPRSPGRYLAGIECDGATYHSFKIARDRDRQRQKILEGLGWTILRVWSTDWFRDASAELDHLHAALEEQLALPVR